MLNKYISVERLHGHWRDRCAAATKVIHLSPNMFSDLNTINTTQHNKLYLHNIKNLKSDLNNRNA